MKTLVHTLLLLTALLSLSSCSSDSEPDYIGGTSDKAYLSKLAIGKTAVSFQMDDYSVKEKYADQAKWQDFDVHEYYGWQVPFPARITFYKGSLLTPLSFFNISTGPHLLYLPFEAYKIATGFDGDIMVAHALSYDPEHGILAIDDEDVCNVTGASSGSLVIEYMTRFWTEDHGAGVWKWTMSYASSDFLRTPIDMANVYPSDGEAYLGVIEMMRREFGDSFDMNPYLVQEGMRSENSIVDLNELEAAVRAMYGL